MLRRRRREVPALCSGSRGTRQRRRADLLSIFLEQDGYEGAFRLFHEGHFSLRVHINAYVVAEFDLSSGDQIGQGEDDEALDGALEMAGAVFRIGAFVEQEALDPRCATEDELAVP